MTNVISTKRHYLHAAERRESILRAADEVVRDSGITGLNMLAVAAHAGVSRQLLYRYFTDANDLVESWFRFRFRSIQESFVRAFETLGGDPVKVAETQLHVVLSLPIRDQRLIQSVVGDLAHSRPELADTVTGLRRRMLDRWVGLVAPDQVEDPVMRARIWGLVHVMLGLIDFLEVGAITVEQAHSILMDFALTIADHRST